jgi:hypothetical protein
MELGSVFCPRLVTCMLMTCARRSVESWSHKCACTSCELARSAGQGLVLAVWGTLESYSPVSSGQLRPVLSRRMIKQCFEKCVDHFHDSELSLGENTCLDRFPALAV